MFSRERMSQERDAYAALTDSPLPALNHLYAFNPLITAHTRPALKHWWRFGDSATPQSFLPWDRMSAHERRLQALGRRIYQEPAERFETSPTRRAYEQLMTDLAELHKQVCVVRPPHTSEYLRATAERPTFAQADTLLRDMALKHRARYVDVRELPLDWNDYSLFRNSDHLSPKGASLAAPLVIHACFPEPSTTNSSPASPALSHHPR